MENNNRSFKGIWIPAEIWLSQKLSTIEKVLIAEISSLDNDKEKGCFASNEYLANFMQLSEGRIVNILTELRKKNIVYTCYNDGRSRGIRVNNEELFNYCVDSEYMESCNESPRNRGISEHNFVESYSDKKQLEKKNINNINTINSINIKKKISKKSEQEKLVFGEHQNVFLTLEEAEKIKLQQGGAEFDAIVDKLSNYKLASGKKYKSDYGAINTWVIESVKTNQNKQSNGTTSTNKPKSNPHLEPGWSTLTGDEWFMRPIRVPKDS